MFLFTHVGTLSWFACKQGYITTADKDYNQYTYMPYNESIPVLFEWSQAYNSGMAFFWAAA